MKYISSENSNFITIYRLWVFELICFKGVFYLDRLGQRDGGSVQNRELFKLENYL